MPLIKGGKISEDSFVRILDDRPIPDGTSVLVPADRFLADAAEFGLRQAPTGVLWPNDRGIAELAPHLDHLALVALIFPSFRDGRAYSQARQLREQHGYRGEIRATGEVLRDQFLFMLRAGFDSFEVQKMNDANAYAEAVSRYSIFYQPRVPGAPARLARSSGSRSRSNGDPA